MYKRLLFELQTERDFAAELGGSEGVLPAAGPRLIFRLQSAGYGCSSTQCRHRTVERPTFGQSNGEFHRKNTDFIRIFQTKKSAVEFSIFDLWPVNVYGQSQFSKAYNFA